MVSREQFMKKFNKELKEALRTNKWMVVCDDGMVYCSGADYDTLIAGGGKLAVFRPGEYENNCIIINRGHGWLLDVDTDTYLEQGDLIALISESLWNQ